MSPLTLLVPVDFSNNSLIALKFAKAILQNRPSLIILMHVRETPNFQEQLSENLGVDHLLALWEEHAKSKDIEVKSMILDGPVSETILKTATAYSASMIIMGTQGAKSKLDRIMGSNASKVATNSQCPVLVIPESMPFRMISKIVVGIDPNLEYDHTMAWLSGLILQEKTEVTLFSAGSSTTLKEMEQYQFRISQIIATNSPKCKVNHKVVATVDTVSSLDNLVQDLDADLLVLTTHHRGVFDRIFDASLTRKMTMSSSIPVLAIPLHKVPVYFF